MQKWAVAAFVAVVMIGGSAIQGADAPKSLYDRLGGQPAVKAVADGLVDRILKDPRVNPWFAHAASSPENTNLYKAKLATFICAGVGGPCKYTGLSMDAAHKGRHVTSAAFDAVAEDLVAQLNELKVPAKEKSEVMSIIGSLKPSIVQSKPPSAE